MSDPSPRSWPFDRASWRLDDRAVLWLTWLVAAFGLGLRVIVVHATNEVRIDSPARLGGDEVGYDGLARDVLAGYGFTWPGRVPLYPLWLAALHRAFGNSYDAITVAQAFLGATVVPLTAALGRRVAGPVAGLVAGTLAAVSYVLVRQPTSILSEVMFTPLVVLIALSLCTALDQPSRRTAAIAGAWIGLANLVRPTLVLFPVVVVGLLVHRLGWRRGVALGTLGVCVTLAVQTPWMLHNAKLGRPVWTLATSNGILWQGSPEYYHLTHDRGYGYLRVWEEVLYGPTDDAPDPGSIEGESYWRARALRSIAREPLVYLRYAAEKSVTYWVGDPNADWADSHVLDFRAVRRTGFTRAQTISILTSRTLLPVAALLALVILWRRHALPHAIVALLAYCTALHAATHAEARLSEPLQPLLFVLLAAAGSRPRAAPDGGGHWVHHADVKSPVVG